MPLSIAATGARDIGRPTQSVPEYYSIGAAPKLDARDRAQLVIVAYKTGLIHPA